MIPLQNTLISLILDLVHFVATNIKQNNINNYRDNAALDMINKA